MFKFINAKNSRQAWKVRNKMTNKKKFQPSPKLIENHSILYEEQQQIADLLNETFINYIIYKENSSSNPMSYGFIKNKVTHSCN